MYDELVKSLRDCARVNSLSLYKRGLMTQAADAIEERCQQVDKFMDEAARLYAKLPRWIPVTERNPEHGWYLAYGPTIKMEVLHFHSVEEVWSSERYYNIEVTHWMPLPEPPKEET